MRRVLSSLSVVILACGAAAPYAQVRPDFSGKWLLTTSTPDGTAAMGAEFMISQEAAAIHINQDGFVIGGTSPGSGISETRNPVGISYELDGVEHPTNRFSEPRLPSPLPPATPGGMSMSMVESVSKATWVGDELVIMNYNKMRATAPGRTPSDVVIRQTIRQVLALDVAGALVVERLIVADPTPWGRKAASPVPVRSVYKKASALAHQRTGAPGRAKSTKGSLEP